MKRSAIGPIVVALAIATASGAVYGQDADSKAFITDLTIAGLAEVQLGKLAAERAASPDVKAFGQMMVKDHTQAANELKPIAMQLNVQQPTQVDQKHKDLADKLSKLEGSAFDREYINAMVMGHEEVAAKIRTRVENHTAARGAAGADHPPGSVGKKDAPGAQGGNKPAPHDAGHPAPAAGPGEQKLTQWAAMVLPTVQMHLERARELQKKSAE
jgi:predicted outer membrane protein